MIRTLSSFEASNFWTNSLFSSLSLSDPAVDSIVYVRPSLETTPPLVDNFNS